MDGPITKCTDATFCLEIVELRGGNVEGEWGLWIRDLEGNWTLADTFELKGTSAEVELHFEPRISFDAWACLCHCLGEYWDFSYSTWNESYTTMEYRGE